MSELIVEKMKCIWNDNFFFELSNEIQKEINAAATGGEIISNVASFLVELKKRNPVAFDNVREQLKEFKIKYRRYLYTEWWETNVPG